LATAAPLTRLSPLLTRSRWRLLMWHTLTRACVTWTPLSPSACTSRHAPSGFNALRLVCFDASFSVRHLQASLQLRNGVLGVTDPGVSPSEAFTSVHRQILEAVARGRARGALQADIAKALNIPNNNFFYQVTRLEARGLLKRAAVRPPATAQQPGDKKTPVRSSRLFTHVLTRF
jgi:hypothetical protein